MKKIAAILVLLGALVICAPAMAAEPMFEDTAGHWAEEEINRWAGYGVISGWDGYFRPQDNITVAEFSAILDNVMRFTDQAEYDPEIYKDLNADDWYLPAMLRLAKAGIIAPNREGKLNPAELLTRADEAVMLAKAFSLTPVSGAVTFRDNDEIAPSVKPYVKAMQEEGYITGYPSGTGFAFRPDQPVTRAEAVAMIGVIVAGYVDGSGDVTGSVDGNVLVSAAGSELSLADIAGNLYISGGASDVTINDVTVKGDTIINSPGKVKVLNSRMNAVLVDAVGGNTALTVEGAINIHSIEMRTGGVIEALPNDYGFIRNTIISKSLPEGQTVTLKGDFRQFMNNARESAVNRAGAVFNTADIKPVEATAVTGSRPTNNRLTADITSRSLGTAYVLILKDTATREPSRDEIMDKKIYEPAAHVFDYGSFRVYPNNTETFVFTGANQKLGIDNQGHKIYVIVEDGNGALAEAVSEPVYFRPGVEDVYVEDAKNIIAVFDHPFDSGAAVEECYDLYIGSGMREKVSYRAYNVFPDPNHESWTYRLSLVYGDSLEEAVFVSVEPKNGQGQSMTAAYNPRSIFAKAFNAVTTLDNTVDISGSVSKRCDIYWVLTDEYVRNVRQYAYDIASENFPVTSVNTRYGNLLAQNGDFRTYINGFSETPEYYYLYVYITDGVGSPEVRMYVIE
ncbi:MAG: S-layer homology domain-containing protein [Clostridiales bacterium]|jgi:hypothetical protein|nr:S-layer homology domain-containing protein [Clostridiales bacterium]